MEEDNELEILEEFPADSEGSEPNDDSSVEDYINEYEERSENLRNGILGGSPIEKQFDTFEQNANGDPFRNIKKSAEIFKNYFEKQSTVETIEQDRQREQFKDRLGIFYKGMAQRVIESAPSIVEKDNKKSFFETPLPGTYATQGAQLSENPVTGAAEISTGFVGRPGVEEYKRLFSSGSKVKASFFQFQQRSVISQMVLDKNTSWEIATQHYSLGQLESNVSRDDMAKDIDSLIDIYGGNTLAMEVSNLLAEQGREDLQIYGVKSIGSFHPKVGYVSNEENEVGYAFIGSQNLTPALEGRNTIESMFVFSSQIDDIDKINTLTKDVKGTTKAFREQILTKQKGQIVQARIAQEIKKATDILLKMTKEAKERNAYIKPGELYRRMERDGGFTNLTADQGILPRLQEIISRASQSESDKVLIASGQVSLLLGDKDTTNKDLIALRQAALKLAKEGRLTVVTQQNTYDRILKEWVNRESSSGKSDSSMDQLADVLIKTGALKAAPSQGRSNILHEKATLVFDKQGEVQAIVTGSANYSARALMPIQDLGDLNSRQIENKLEVVEREFAGKADYLDIQEGTLNTELSVVIANKRYGRESQDDSDLLDDYNQSGEIKDHYATLAGVRDFDSEEKLYDLGYAAEKIAMVGKTPINPMDPYDEKDLRRLEGPETGALGTHSVSSLWNAIEVLKQSMPEHIAKGIKVEARYGEAQMPGLLNSGGNGGSTTRRGIVGLKVTIQPVGGLAMHSTTLDLTVNQSGQVILSDTNQVITGSLYVNQSTTARIASNGAVVNPGESVQLNAIETASSLVYTIAETLQDRAQSSLVTDAFSRMASTKGTHQIENFLAETVGSILMNDSTGSDVRKQITQIAGNPKGDRFTMEMIQGLLLNKQTQKTVLEAISIAKDLLKSGFYNFQESTFNEVQNLSEESKIRREAVIEELFINLVDSERISRGSNVSRAVGGFMNSLLFSNREVDDNAFLDLKAAILMSDPTQKSVLMRAARAQANELKNLLTSPFLQPHGLGYSSVQGLARLPVFGDYGEEREGYQLGLLNPLNVKAATQLGSGTTGKYVRLIGAVSYGERMNLPNSLGIRELRTIDSGLNLGAVSVYDAELIGRGLSGLGYLTKEELRKAFEEIHGISVSEDESTVDELIQKFADKYGYTEEDLEGGLLFTPFNKLEQIVQRFKNVMGSRAAFDVNMDLIRGLTSLTNSSDITSKIAEGDVSAGRLRTSLPSHHFEKIKEKIAEFESVHGRKPTYEELQAYYRQLELDPTSVDRGYIGSSGLRRVAVSAGLSLMGDFSYINPDFDQRFADSGFLTIKYNANNTSNPIAVQKELAEMFRQGSFILGKARQLETEEIEKYGLSVLKDVVDPTARPSTEGLDEAALNERLATLQEKGLKDETNNEILVKKEFYNSFFVSKDDEGRLSFMQKEGLYVADGDLYVRKGELNDSGRIITVSLGRDLPSGRVHEKLTVGFSGFTRRSQEGITFITQAPNLHVEGSQVTMQVGVINTFKSSSGSRPAGQAELIKGPFLMMSKKLWSFVDDIFTANASSGHRELLPTDIYTELETGKKTSKSQLYGMFTFNTFKGFSFDAGLEMVRDDRTRQILSNVSGEEIAKALSIALMDSKDGGNEVKQAVVNKVRNNGQYRLAEAIRVSDTKDYSSGGMGMLSIGMEAFGDVKTLVIEALSDDKNKAKQAQQKLEKAYKSLLEKSVTEDNSQIISDEKGNEVRFLDSNKPTVRTAAFVSNLVFVGRQIFNPQLKHAAGANGETLADIGKVGDRVDDYINDIGFRQRIDVLASQLKIDLPKLDDLRAEKIIEKPASEGDYESEETENEPAKKTQEVLDKKASKKKGIDLSFLTRMVNFFGTKPWDKPDEPDEPEEKKKKTDSVIEKTKIEAEGVSHGQASAKPSSRKALSSALRKMDAILEHNYLIEYVIETQVSRSLYPAGSKDDVPLEYQYLIGAPSSYFRKFDAKLGQGKQRSEEINRAYSVIMSSGTITKPTGSGVLLYRLALPAPESYDANERVQRGFLNSQLDYVNRYSTSYSNVGVPMQSLQEMELVNQILHSSYGRDEEALYERATALMLEKSSVGGSPVLDLPFLSFIDDHNTNPVARKQLEIIQKYLGKTNASKPIALVSTAYAKAAEEYYNYKGKNSLTFSEFILSSESFKDYKHSEKILELEKKFRIAEQLQTGGGAFRPIAEKKDSKDRLIFDKSTTKKNIRRALKQASEKTIERVKETVNMSAEERFMRGMLELEKNVQKDIDQLNKYQDESYIDRQTVPVLTGDQIPQSIEHLEGLLAEVQNSRQIILPAFDGYLNKETGKFQVQLKTLDESAPTVGLLYGTDLLKTVALSFPGFQSSALRNQMIARQKLALFGGKNGLLQKVVAGKELSQAEYTELVELQTLIEQTGSDAQQFAEQSVVRKAYGDQIGMKGFVGIAVNSLALNANEVIVGERARSTTRNLHVLSVLQDQIRRVSRADDSQFEQELNSVKTMLRLFGDESDFLNQTARDEKDKIATMSEVTTLITDYRSTSNALKEFKNLKSRRKLSSEEVEEYKNLRSLVKDQKGSIRTGIYSFVTGVSKGKINESLSKPKLRKRLNLLESSIRRSGAPSGAVMQTNAENLYQVLFPDDYNDMLATQKSLMEVDLANSQTALILPTVGRLLPMLGDFDGDSYQFLTSTSGFHLSEINVLNKKIQDVESNLNRKRKSVSYQRDGESKTPTGLSSSVEEEIRILEIKKQKYEEERQEILTNLSGYSGNGSFARNKAALDDVKQWAGNYLALPKFMTQGEDAGSLNAGQAMGMVQFMRVLFPAFDDNRVTIDEAKKSGRIMTSLFRRAATLSDSSFAALNQGSSSSQLDQFVRDMNAGREKSDIEFTKEDAKLMRELRQELSLNKNMDADEIENKIDAWYVGNIASTSAMFNTFNKTVSKAAGNVLANREQEAIQGVFGEAGSKLIGQVYNSFAPLLDSAMKANSMEQMLNNSKFRSVLKESLELLSKENQNPESAKIAAGLITDLGLREEDVEKRNAVRELYQEQFNSITSTLAALQQSVRDALKFKEATGLREILKQEDIAGKLEAIEGQTEVERNVERSKFLRNFIMEKMGPAVPFDRKEGEVGVFDKHLSTVTIGGEKVERPNFGMSGFGVLLSMYEFAQTEDSRMDEMVKSHSLFSELYDEVRDQKDISQTDFMADALADLIKKTQASFIYDSIKSETGLFIEKSKEYYEASKAKGVKDQFTILTKTYLDEESRLTNEGGTADDHVRLRQQFMHSMIFSEIDSRKGFTGETIKELRRKTQVTMGFRTGADEFDQVAHMIMEDTYSALNMANRRGQQPSAQDQNTILKTQMYGFLSAMQENPEMFSEGKDITQYAQFLTLLSTNLPDGPLAGGSAEEERNKQLVLARAIVQKFQSEDGSDTSQPVLNTMLGGMTSMEQMFGAMDSLASIQSAVVGDIQENGVISESTAMREDFLNETIYNLQKASAADPEDTIKNLINSELDLEIDKTIRTQSNKIGQLVNEKSNKSLFDHDPKMELVGSLIAPLALGLLTDAPTFDDRMISTGFDILQSMAHINTKDDRLSTMVAKEQEKVNSAATNAQRGRIRDMISQEGMVFGAAQGALQELLFQSTSELAYGLIDKTLRKTDGGKIKGMRGLGVMAAETLSTVMSLSLSKRLAKKSSAPREEPTGNIIGQMLDQITTYVWQAAEEALLRLTDPDVEVLDTDINDSMDFEYSAAPSELSADLESGMVVVDDKGREMQTEDGSDFASMISGASSVEIGGSIAASAGTYSG